MKQSPLIAYLKAAFLWRWNLLAFGAAAVFAILSGQPDVVLPLAAAAELAYVGLLATHPRFRRAVDARRASAAAPAEDNGARLNRIRRAIRPEAWRRFEDLRDRCLHLSRLAAQFRGTGGRENATLAEMQTGSLERLLWMFLNLLYSQDALEEFLAGTNRAELEAGVGECEGQLTAAREQGRDEKLVKSLEDRLATLRQRLENHERALENLDFLAAEIDRIEQKVNAIGELAINAPGTMDITAEVDGIAEGVSATEEAMRNLDMAPALRDKATPRLLREEL